MQDMLSNRVQAIAESATLKMSRLAGELRSQGHEVISLSLGEPDFDTPDYIKEAAKRALDEGYTKYTPVPGLPELRQAICDKFARENGLTYTIDQIVVSNGAKQTISNLYLSLVNPGDEVILFTPYWVSYRDIASVVDAKIIELDAGIDQDYKVSAAQLEAAITDKTKFILFSSPCNPTGSVYSHDELAAMATVLERHPHVLVISDEIYEYISFKDQHVSIAQFEVLRDRVVVVNGLSKGYAMTGWRLGYMAAPTWLAKACSKIQSQSTSGATAFGQRAAVTAINQERTMAPLMVETYRRRREIMYDGLNAIEGLKANYPEGAFYIFPDISGLLGKKRPDGTVVRDSSDLSSYLLESVYVATVAGQAFGAPNCIRLSFAASDAELKEAVRRIKVAVEALG